MINRIRMYDQTATPRQRYESAVIADWWQTFLRRCGVWTVAMQSQQELAWDVIRSAGTKGAK